MHKEFIEIDITNFFKKNNNDQLGISKIVIIVEEKPSTSQKTVLLVKNINFDFTIHYHFVGTVSSFEVVR